jgi:alpha-galactosidase
MGKITIIGAGSGFGSRLAVDMMARPNINDSTICLCDLDEKRLKGVLEYLTAVRDANKLKTKFEIGTDRKKLLPGSDIVVIAVSIGGGAYYGKPYEHEIRIPEKYGIHHFIGDTMGPGGLFRGLRCAPELIRMVKDVNELAPGATILNYTNPMAILTWAMSENVDNGVDLVGLCHGIQTTSKTLAKYAGVPYEEMGFSVSGINHMSWFTKLTHKGKDIYPKVYKAFDDHEIYKKDWVRLEIMKNFGYFCTESSRHSFEYIPHFCHSEKNKKEFTRPIIEDDNYIPEWYEDMGIKKEDAQSLKLVHSKEFAAGIIEAKITNVGYKFYGNTINKGLIDNFHNGCCVEVPCLADRHGIHPCHVDPLPEQCAALCRTNINMQELAVKAIREKSKEIAFYALALDPSVQANMNIGDMRKMFEELWKVEADMGLLDEYK